jgi:hypothetical protein
MLEVGRGVTSYPELIAGGDSGSDITDEMSGPDAERYHHLGKRELRQGMQDLDRMYEAGGLTGYERLFYESVIQNERMHIPVEGNLAGIVPGMRSYDGQFRDLFMTALEPYMRHQDGIGIGDILSAGALTMAAFGAKAGEWVAGKVIPSSVPKAMMRYGLGCAGSDGSSTYR